MLSGVAAVWTGRTTEGFGDLDEAMLAVVSGAVPAQWAGDVYCTVIHLCHLLGDLVRMRAWTDALEQWATPLSTTFMFAGITRVHQLQLLSAEGDWHTVEHEVAGRSRELVGSHGWVAAEGFRELGDVRRLRGDTVGARSAYARTRDLGVTPQPGEALLDEAEGRRGRPSPSCVPRCPSRAGSAGRACCCPRWRLPCGPATWPSPSCPRPSWRRRPHSTTPPGCGPGPTTPLPVSCCTTAPGTWPASAWRRRPASTASSAAATRRLGCTSCSPACTRDAARTRAAEAEVATALAIYRQLGAAPDVARLAPHRPPGGLTEREVEVLGCVLGGASNRDIARHLVISEKTVSRHLANIYAKAGVSSRTGAAAWGRDHGVDPVRTAPAPAPNDP